MLLLLTITWGNDLSHMTNICQLNSEMIKSTVQGLLLGSDVIRHVSLSIGRPGVSVAPGTARSCRCRILNG